MSDSAKQIGWLIETSDGRYLRFDDDETAFVWTRDVHAAHRYRTEEMAREAWSSIKENWPETERQSRGLGIHFNEHEWASGP